MILTGIFASKLINPAGANGLAFGETALFWAQLKGLAVVVSYSFIVSFGIFKLINVLSPLRVTKQEEMVGLDETQHGEKYVQGTLLVDSNGIVEEKVLG
jgi:Amt family ammonium transporter